MPIYRLLLPLLTLISALIAIAALSHTSLPRELAFVAKPLTTVLIMLYAWPRGADAPRQARLLRLGLAFSLAGDVALLWPESGFVPGLLCFLVAHLLYIAAFCQHTRLARPWWPWLMFGLIAGYVLSRLWPGVPAALQVPVLAYVVCLAAMAAQAWSWWRASIGGAREPLARWAAWGGTLFLASDALLAINKFAGPLPEAALWVLSTYWSAQWCIASSLRGGAAQA